MINNTYRILIFLRIPLFIHWTTILILTSLPSESLPSVSLGDKVEHFLAFFVLGFFLYLNFLFQNKIKILQKYPFAFTLLICASYGAFDELHQLLIPGRSAEFIDWLADFFGAIVGISFSFLISKLFKENLRNFLKLKLEPLPD